MAAQEGAVVFDLPKAVAHQIRLQVTGQAGGGRTVGAVQGQCKGTGLSRAEREAIGVVVSAENECAYCVNHHAGALRHFIDDEETLSMLATADGLETLEPRLSNIVRHAQKLTSAPEAMTESDLGELRAVGLNDRDILDLTLITAYFNFVNRIVLGLGVEYTDEEAAGYLND